MKKYDDSFILELMSIIENNDNIMIHGLRSIDTGLNALEKGLYLRTLTPNFDEIYEDTYSLYTLKDQNLEILHGTCTDLFYIPYLEKLPDCSFCPELKNMYIEIKQREESLKEQSIKTKVEVLYKILRYNYIDGRGKDCLLLIGPDLDERIIRKLKKEEKIEEPYVRNCDAVLDRKYIIALVDKKEGKIIYQTNEKRKINESL